MLYCKCPLASDGVYYCELIPRVTCLTVLEKGGNLQKSSVNVELRTFVTKHFSLSWRIWVEETTRWLTLALCYPDGYQFPYSFKNTYLKMFTP